MTSVTAEGLYIGLSEMSLMIGIDVQMSFKAAFECF